MERVEAAIAQLEQLQSASSDGCAMVTSPNKSKRGRKSMGSDERQEVSQRMKKYWAGRRKAS